MNNLTIYTDPLRSLSPESPVPEFAGNLGEPLSSGEWTPPGGNTRQVCIVEDCRSSVADACPNWSFLTVGSDGSVESVLLCEEVQNFCGAGETTSVIDCGTVNALPSEEEKRLVKQMLADALACQGQSLLPEDKKMPATPVASSPASVTTGIHPMDESMALPVDPSQVTEHMPQPKEVVHTQKSSPLATLSTWLNNVSKPRLAVKPKRLKQHSVRPHPYPQAKTVSACSSKSSDTFAPVPEHTVPANGHSRLSPTQYVSVICRVDN